MPYFFWLTAAFSVILLLSGSPVLSEIVPHHGRQVEAEGSVAHCAACHDGVQAPNAAICTKNCDIRHGHPVLRSYPPAGKESDYAPESTVLMLGIRLPGNKIACTSCHNLRNNDRYHLVLTDHGSALCFACHLK